MSLKAPRIFGLLGFPVSHSLSPAMHNAAFKYLRIDAQYRLFPKQPHELSAFFESMRENDIQGLNVTVPYKEKALQFVTLDNEFLYLKDVGAINTVICSDAVLRGFNTDIAGFAKDFDVNAITIAKKNIALLGAGGAARAVSYCLAAKRAKEIAIYDIDPSKSQTIIAIVKHLFPGTCMHQVESIKDLNLRDKDVLINATPIGLHKDDPCIIPQEMLHKNMVVYDLIYNPQETPLLHRARISGAGAYNGLGMLLYQGALSFEYFTGVSAPLKVMKEALDNAIVRLVD